MTLEAPVKAYQHGIYPRSERVVALTRDLERGRATPEQVESAFSHDVEDFIRVQQEARLDYFSDGLLRWQDIFRPLVESAEGMEAGGLVRWFDNNAFFRAPLVKADPRIGNALPDVLANGKVPKPRVATLPSPFMFSRAAHATTDRNHLMRELAIKVLAPVARSLAGQGTGLIQLQEPWLVYYGAAGADWDALGEAIAAMRRGITVPVVLHTYYGDASRAADRLRALPVDAVGVDAVMTDLERLSGPWQTGLLLGCLDGRSSLVEETTEVVEMVRHLIDRLKPASLYLSSNSDLELLPQAVAARKVRRLGEIVRVIKEGTR